MNEDIFKKCGIEIELIGDEGFLKVRETLTRIGISSKRKKELFQSCHILHKRGRYVILHFKELFLLDGKPANFSEDDKARRNTIVNLLEEWGLVRVLKPSEIEDPVASMSQIKILPHAEKNNWNLVAKYTIGNKQ